MSHLSKLRELEKDPASDPGTSMIVLGQAIHEKIENLEKSLKTRSNFFFKLPGIASREDTGAKIELLKKLKNLVSINQALNIPGGLASVSNNVLDGETLELFKFAVKIFPTKFSKEDRENIEDRNPAPRLLRF